ncbi:hypothetical protein HKCCE4037_06325 [Rhodobacterales bacterium HKCCE4037]|nr:hypothetical protein [Rhodobacterales bacterium HKCCE4037]
MTRALAFLLVLTPLQAEAQFYCGRNGAALAQAVIRHGEFPLIELESHLGGTITLVVNLETGTWTLIEENGNEECVWLFGTGYRLAGEPS